MFTFTASSIHLAILIFVLIAVIAIPFIAYFIFRKKSASLVVNPIVFPNATFPTPVPTTIPPYAG